MSLNKFKKQRGGQDDEQPEAELEGDGPEGVLPKPAAQGIVEMPGFHDEGGQGDQRELADAQAITQGQKTDKV